MPEVRCKKCGALQRMENINRGRCWKCAEPIRIEEQKQKLSIDRSPEQARENASRTSKGKTSVQVFFLIPVFFLLGFLTAFILGMTIADTTGFMSRGQYNYVLQSYLLGLISIPSMYAAMKLWLSDSLSNIEILKYALLIIGGICLIPIGVEFTRPAMDSIYVQKGDRSDHIGRYWLGMGTVILGFVVIVKSARAAKQESRRIS